MLSHRDEKLHTVKTGPSMEGVGVNGVKTPISCSLVSLGYGASMLLRMSK